MANSDKNIVIIPNKSSSSEDPKIVFSGADSATSAKNVTITAYPYESGTVSIESTSGQLFSVTNDSSDTIFTVNDIAGIPKIEVNAQGVVKLVEYGGRTIIGPGTDNEQSTLQINGNVSAISQVSGTLVVRGGVGISGDVYAGDVYSNGELISGSGGATALAIAFAVALGS